MYFFFYIDIKNDSIKVNLNTLGEKAPNKAKKNGEVYADECAMGTFSFTDLDKQKTCDLKKYDSNLKNMAVVPGLNLKGKC